MLRLGLILCVDLFSMHCVICQFENNDPYNQMYIQFNKENEASNTRDFVEANNQQQSRSYHSEYKEKPMPYQFEYNIDDGYGNKQDRQEKGDEDGYVKGSYGYMDSNGIYRHVEYTAGPDIGFIAKITTNQPSIKPNANPADVMLMVNEPPRNSYINDMRQPDNDNQHVMIDNQIKQHILNAFDNQERQLDKRYAHNLDTRFATIQPFFPIIKPNPNRNINEDDYRYSDSAINRGDNENINNMQLYASNSANNRRYYYD